MTMRMSVVFGLSSNPRTPPRSPARAANVLSVASVDTRATSRRSSPRSGRCRKAKPSIAAATAPMMMRGGMEAITNASMTPMRRTKRNCHAAVEGDVATWRMLAHLRRTASGVGRGGFTRTRPFHYARAGVAGRRSQAADVAVDPQGPGGDLFPRVLRLRRLPCGPSHLGRPNGIGQYLEQRRREVSWVRIGNNTGAVFLHVRPKIACHGDDHRTPEAVGQL